MQVAIIILIIIVALFLTIAVLVQNSKGGGLASNIGISSNQFGVKKTSDFLEKLTWGLALSLVVLCLGINVLMKNEDTGEAEVPSSVNVERAKESKVPSMAAPEAEGESQSPAAADPK